MDDIKLLIVDDEVEIRTSLARRYTLKGYVVSTAEDGQEALNLMSEEPFNVVITDIRMPKVNGVELLREIRKEYPMTRVIMMTGYVTLENGLAALKYGADTCIFKPFDDLKELDGAIESALEYLRHWEKKLLTLRSMNPNKGGN